MCGGCWEHECHSSLWEFLIGGKRSLTSEYEEQLFGMFSLSWEAVHELFSQYRDKEWTCPAISSLFKGTSLWKERDSVNNNHSTVGLIQKLACKERKFNLNYFLAWKCSTVGSFVLLFLARTGLCAFLPQHCVNKVAHTCSPRLQGVQEGRTEGKGHSTLCNAFEASLGIVRHCLKTKQTISWLLWKIHKALGIKNWFCLMTHGAYHIPFKYIENFGTGSFRWCVLRNFKYSRIYIIFLSAYFQEDNSMLLWSIC